MIFIEQWMEKKNRIPAVIGVVGAFVCLQIFGADSFVLPSMLLIVLILFVGKRDWIRRKEDAGKCENFDLIILAVALTTFATRVTPFWSFRKERDSRDDTVSWKSIDTGSDRDACCILLKKYTSAGGTAWYSGVDCCDHGCGSACVETKQSAQYRGRNGAVYVFDSGCILIKIGTRVSKRTLVLAF